MNCVICGTEFKPRNSRHKTCGETCKRRYAVVVVRAWQAENPERARKHREESIKRMKLRYAQDPEYREKKRRQENERSLRKRREKNPERVCPWCGEKFRRALMLKTCGKPECVKQHNLDKARKWKATPKGREWSREYFQKWMAKKRGWWHDEEVHGFSDVGASGTVRGGRGHQAQLRG